MNVPMAYGDPRPLWPLPNDARPKTIRESRRFGAYRKDKKTGRPRHHAAIDLGSAHLHPVVAPEAGRVVALQTFLGPRNHALLLASDASGVVLLLGEMDPAHWKVEKGEHVSKGQLLGVVGTSDMLHFGAFRPGTRQTVQWFEGEPPPPELLDPTHYVAAMMADSAVPDVERKTIEGERAGVHWRVTGTPTGWQGWVFLWDTQPPAWAQLDDAAGSELDPVLATVFEFVDWWVKNILPGLAPAPAPAPSSSSGGGFGLLLLAGLAVLVARST